VSDRTEIVKYIVDKVNGAGAVIFRGALTNDNPLLLVPHKDPGVVLRVSTFERFNGAYVLSIDLPLGSFANIKDLRERLWKMTEWLPFCSVRFEATDETHWDAFFTHALLVDDNLSTEQIAQAVGSMVHTFYKARPMIAAILEEETGGEESCDGCGEEDADIPEPEFIAEDNDEKVNVFDMYEGGPMTRFTTNMPDTAQQIVPVRTSTSEVLEALNNLVGLAPVKEVVHQLVARQRVEQLRAGKGMKVVLPSPHLVFTGNPGTGKTTVAHLVGELYSTLGILKKGHVVEVNRSGLVAAYVGQTALKTRAVCTQALGGVLFIDEAYSLLGDGNDFGAEAIEELLTFMEAHRGEFVVVAAGYPEQMETFLSSNPGLRSRFDTVVHFPDFNDDELLAIFEKLVTENEYTLRGAAVSAAKFLIRNMERGNSFGNGREMRRLFHQVLDVHAMRLNKYERPGTMMLNHLSGIDFFPIMNVVRERKRAERVGTSGGRGYGFGGYL
jgi:hypothetical protein